MENQKFIDEWRQLQKCTHYYWDLLQQTPEAVLKRQVHPDKWSILQIAEHLAGAETAGIQYLLRKQYEPIHNNSFMPAKVRALLLRLALKSPLKFKAPPILATFPTNTSNPATLLNQWQTVRNKLGNYVDNLPREKEQALLFRHPSAGPLNLKQTLSFMADHIKHHRKQVQYLLAQQVKNTKQ